MFKKQVFQTQISTYLTLKIGLSLRRSLWFGNQRYFHVVLIRTDNFIGTMRGLCAVGTKLLV